MLEQRKIKSLITVEKAGSSLSVFPRNKHCDMNASDKAMTDKCGTY